MSSSADTISPGKKYALAMLDLIERDPQIAALQPDESIGKAINSAVSMYDTLEVVFNGYADRPALGERAYSIHQHTATGACSRQYQSAFETRTYAQVQARVKALAMAWRHHPDHAVGVDEMVCVMGFTSRDFATIDYATLYAHAVSVPLQSATSGSDLNEIFANVEPVMLATTIADLDTCVTHALAHDSIRSLVVFDYDARDDQERAAFEAARDALAKQGKESKRIITLDALIEFGEAYPWQALPAHPDGHDRMAAIIHSSGSTGKPKGAIITEEGIKLNWDVRPRQLPVVTLCIAPLNHLMGRMQLAFALRLGGTACFTLKPDMSSLFEDFRLVRPTYQNFFPRVFEMVHQHYQNEVARRVRNGEADEETVRARVAEEMGKSYLGDRLRWGVVGSAPTSNSVMNFMRETFDMRLNNGYGNTESGSGGITFDGIVQRPPVIEYKLRDVPELGYYTTDKPYPRGEFCFKAKGNITRYFKAPEATAGLFDEDGFSRTGDIVEERAHDHVVVIDRLKDVLKLSQGEYVAVGTLGTVFEAGSGVIKQIYIYGNSVRAYLLAVVVPDTEVAAAKLGDDYDEASLKTLIRDELQRVAAAQQLKSFEVPRDFIIDEDAFSQENGLLSSVRKRLRPALKRKYGDRLEAMYEAHEDAQESEMAAIKDPQSTLTVTEKLQKLLQVQLKVEAIDITRPRNFNELGGDSLGAVLFSSAIDEIFGVSLPADTLLSPTGHIGKWATLIEQAQSGDSDRPSFERIHGKGATRVHAADLQLRAFIGEELFARAHQSAAPVADARTVLLTGANGFLGRCVALEWLEKLAPRGGKLVCLIRAADDLAARERLASAFKGVDPEFEQRFLTLAADHLEVVAGDAGEPNLGLDQATFDQLAKSVDRISHVAALVNHRFSYANLFGPNVVGVAEIIRLALSERLKPIDFVSSEAVFPYTDVSLGTTEDTPLLNSVDLIDNYAAGYGVSKWAGEQLLQQAHREFGLPVNAFRGDMMLPHRYYQGVMNTADMFSRLLFSLIKTGLMPLSFYRLMPNGCLANGHYDGTPVDVVAAAVAGAETHREAGYQNFNVQNFHHDDGCSLDAFADWINKAGYPLTRIMAHDEWFNRFIEKLNTLDEREKQQSALEIRAAFASPISFRPKPFSCERFQSLVTTLHVGPTLPHLDRNYIEKCLADLRFLGLVDAPTATTGSPEPGTDTATRSVAAWAATQADAPLQPLTIDRRTPEADDVAIDILFCGVCHTDLHSARNEWGVSQYPLVPGHEIVGRVTAVGSAVSRYQAGDMVAVGCLVDSCRHCHSCDDGLEQYCEQGAVMTYGALDYRHDRALTQGGYSKHIVVNERFVLRLPNELDPAGAAPLLCAGITTYSPLREWNVGPGQKIGVIGLGGLGHMAVKLAHAMGAHVVMITTSPEKGADAMRLGADEVLVSKDREAMRAQRNSFDFLLDTIPVPHPMNTYLQLLKRDGTLAMVGALEPLENVHGALISAKRLRIVGSMIGGLPETQEMLDFCGEHGITSDVEIINMSEINEAYERMLNNQVKYRFVIDMASLPDQIR